MSAVGPTAKRHRARATSSRRGCVRATCRVLPPARSTTLIVRATAAARIAKLGIPIALEKRAGAFVSPETVAGNDGISRRPARDKTALGLVAQHRDELGAIVGLGAQRLVRDDDRGSRQCRRRDAVE